MPCGERYIFIKTLTLKWSIVACFCSDQSFSITFIQEIASHIPHSQRVGLNWYEMDITSFVATQRDSALLLGDYSTYRSQLSRRLLSVRKSLGRTTPKTAKYAPKAPITSEDIGRNHAYYPRLPKYSIVINGVLDFSTFSSSRQSGHGPTPCT